LQYNKNYLEKIPFDCYDFFNQNYAEGLIRLNKAKECLDAGFMEAGLILTLLAEENLFHMKILANIAKPKRKKKK